MKYHIVERDVFQAIGVKREFSCGVEGIGIPGVPAFWDRVHKSGTANQLYQLNSGQIKGLLGIIENFNEEKNTIDYWIAAEYSGDVLDELSTFEFPASKWVVFEVRGPIPIAVINAWKQIYSEWFPSNRYEPAAIAPIEVYKEPDPTKPDAYSEIWVPIK